MALYRIGATSTAAEEYFITADSPEEAQAKLERGEWDSWRDLGHEDMEVHFVEEA